MTHKGKVYLAAIDTIIPQLYDPVKVIGKLYSEEVSSKKVHKLAVRSQKKLGIQYRSCVTDIDKLPKLKLRRKDDLPQCWGTRIVENLSSEVGRERIGFLSVAYNNSFHIDTVPNLACQITLEAELCLDQMPLEWSHYGCAGGLFALKSAYDFCATSGKAAVVFVFDQCTVQYKDPIFDSDEKHFMSFLRSTLLFADGGIGLLLIPEELRKAFPGPIIEIKDFEQAFESGNHIRMVDGRFLTREGVKDKMPQLVANKLVNPFLDRLGICKDDIAEWSMHQGGPAVLNEFGRADVLGLTNAQLDRSHKLFQQYGNFSSPSCLFVLNSFFSENKLSKPGARGMVVGFGAGYYLGAMYYQWV